MRKLIFVYGVVCYIMFLGVFLYAIGFVSGYGVPKHINSGLEGPFLQSLLINLALLSLFAVQHSVMARQWFKKKWTEIIPRAAERSTYVLATNIVMILLFWFWQPMTTVIWQVESSAAQNLIWVLQGIGWATVLVSTFLIDHFDLFGLKQVTYHMQNKEHPGYKFVTPFLYRLVRHPLLTGFVIAFWATPLMTTGHLLFAIMTTVYMLVAIQLEERDLISYFGADYQQYRKEVSMICPMHLFKKSQKREAITEG